jgi:hypothetical protein
MMMKRVFVSYMSSYDCKLMIPFSVKWKTAKYDGKKHDTNTYKLEGVLFTTKNVVKFTHNCRRHRRHRSH